MYMMNLMQASGMTQIYLNIMPQGRVYKILVLGINRKFIRTHSGINFVNHSVHL